MKIFTHVSVDLDAAGSVWAARKFIPGAEKAEVVFVSANWDGAEMQKGDYAVDVYAGGKGIKGTKEASGKTHSCFRLILERYALREDQLALRNLTAFIDAGDSTGNAIKALIPNTTAAEQKLLYSVSLGAVFSAVRQISPGNDAVAVEWLSRIFDHFLQAGLNQPISLEEAQCIPMRNAVAVAYNKRGAVQNALFEEHGARAIVYVDGNNLGILRHHDETIRMDHSAIRAVVEAAGETAEWFAHPAGFLFCRGARKAPAKTPSKVKPEDLAEAVRKALAEEDAKR